MYIAAITTGLTWPRFTAGSSATINSKKPIPTVLQHIVVVTRPIRFDNSLAPAKPFC